MTHRGDPASFSGSLHLQPPLAARLWMIVHSGSVQPSV